VDIDAVIDMLRQADWGQLLLGVPFLLLCYLLLLIRWRYLLGNAPSLTETQHVLFSGMMLSIVTPIPNSPFRVVAISRTTEVKATTATSSIAVEYLDSFILRLIGLTLGTVLLLGNLRGSENTLLIGAGAVILLVAALFLLVSQRERIAPPLARALARVPRVGEERAERASSAVVDLLKGTGTPKDFGVALLISIAYWVCALIFYYLALLGLGAESRVPLLLVALGALFLVPPASPMMPGLFHSVLIAPLVAVRWLSSEAATAYAVVLHAMMMVVLIVLGAWGLSRMDLNLGELVAEVRQFAQRGGEDPEAEVAQETTQED
jgi:uncharacterized protein (TIRG00374 family)